ncbi:hypothetical protein Tco_0624359 [Tanacetum coccineum]|uniref:Uncharacterized protein n=1 Tax=Tanacetum coccineum TaxID=301880 RepID=A0ABQ4WDU1_9ASTR
MPSLLLVLLGMLWAIQGFPLRVLCCRRKHRHLVFEVRLTISQQFLRENGAERLGSLGLENTSLPVTRILCPRSWVPGQPGGGNKQQLLLLARVDADFPLLIGVWQDDKGDDSPAVCKHLDTIVRWLLSSCGICFPCQLRISRLVLLRFLLGHPPPDLSSGSDSGMYGLGFSLLTLVEVVPALAPQGQASLRWRRWSLGYPLKGIGGSFGSWCSASAYSTLTLVKIWFLIGALDIFSYTVNVGIFRISGLFART